MILRSKEGNVSANISFTSLVDYGEPHQLSAQGTNVTRNERLDVRGLAIGTARM